MKLLTFLFLAALVTTTTFAVAPELVLKEEDFTYEEYQVSLKWIDDVLEQYYKGKEPGWEIENIGVPNSFLRLQGYGLFTQKEIISLKLENAKLHGKVEDVAILEKSLKEIESQIKVFLSGNIWVD